MNKLILSGYTRNNNRGIHILSYDSEKLHQELNKSNQETDKPNLNISGLDKEIAKLNIVIDELGNETDQISLYTSKSNQEKKRVNDVVFFTEEYFIEEESPTFIAVDVDEDQILAVSARGNGGVSLYKKEESCYVLKDEYLEMGSSPCHLFFDDERRLLYSSNYHKGRLDIFSVGKESLKHTQCMKFEGKSIISPDQDSSRIHMAIMDEYNQNLIVCDLGDDKVYILKIGNDGSAEIGGYFSTDPGFGPRHITYGKKEDVYYLIGELSSEIYVLGYDRNEMKFELIQKISSLPEQMTKKESHIAEESYQQNTEISNVANEKVSDVLKSDISHEIDVKNTAAAIKICSDGRFLYASNRGYDIITVYRIQDDGRIEFLGFEKTYGKTPRDFNFIGEDYILVGHQNEDYCTILSRNRENGRLKYTGKRIDFSEIVCVLNACFIAGLS